MSPTATGSHAAPTRTAAIATCTLLMLTATAVARVAGAVDSPGSSHDTAELVVGTVTDSLSGVHLSDVRVELITGRGDLVAAAMTDAAGRFRLIAPAAGRYRIRAERLGYGAVETEMFDVRAGTGARVDVKITVSPIPLPDVPVTTTSTAGRGTAMDPFYERRERLGRTLGLGRFLGPEDLERRAVVGSAAALLETMPGVRTRSSEWSNWRHVQLRVDGACANPRMHPPKLYIDGGVVRGGTLEALNVMVSAGDLAGVEIYRRPSEIPAEFSGPDAACGVIVLWTKRGR